MVSYEIIGSAYACGAVAVSVKRDTSSNIMQDKCERCTIRLPLLHYHYSAERLMMRREQALVPRRTET
jgi:hypothetical protein